MWAAMGTALVWRCNNSALSRFVEAHFHVQDTADVRCGVTFQLLVQPYDRFGNR